jgi:glycosyltransferase involved in cell wall biosynthesis
VSIPPGEAPPEPSTPAGDEALARHEPDVASELSKVIEEFRVIRADLTARLDDEIARSRELKRALSQAERRIESIYESKTWAAGKALRRLARPLSPAKEVKPASPSVTTDKTLGSVFVEASHPGEPHPLWKEYQTEIAHPLEPADVGAVFMVSTTSFGEGRGDLFVATGLGRYLRRRRISVGYVDQGHWYQSSPDAQWVVAMMPAFRPSQSVPGPKVIGWARNEFMNWLTHPELDRFDALLCSSPAAAVELERYFDGPVHVFPIGVDLELFQPDPGNAGHRGGVVSTVNQWGRERDVYRALRSMPIDFPLRIHGQSAGLSLELAPYDQGPVHFFELPMIYWGARVVLDDFNRTTVAWGAVNSRVFEAIAAGALPVTNSDRGLDSLGLADVPSYNAPEDLNPLVDRLLGDPDGTDALVGKLGAVVRERHTLEARAGDFDRILTAIA